MRYLTAVGHPFGSLFLAPAGGADHGSRASATDGGVGRGTPFAPFANGELEKVGRPLPRPLAAKGGLRTPRTPVWGLALEARDAEGPIPREGEVDRAPVQHEAPDFQLVIPSGSGRLWLALMVCGRIVEVREVAGEEDVLFNVDLAAIAARAGAFRVVGLDAVSGIPIPVLRVHLVADGKGPTWTEPCRPGDAVGPLSPGRYSVMVGATGYENLTLPDLVVEPETLGETIEVRLRRP